jgi:cardiolipin synthase
MNPMRQLLDSGWVTALVLIADWLLRIGLSLRVIMRRRPVGVSLAWISVILIAPFVGAIIYLLFGELRLGRARAKRALEIHGPYAAWLESLRHRYPLPTVETDEEAIHADVPPLARMIEAGAGFPPLPGNSLELLGDTASAFRSLIADIDGAKSTCHLAFYIWAVGGLADDVADALIRAEARGVTCRLLVDAMGSAAFLKSEQAERLRRGGVELYGALRVRPWGFLFERIDLRLHRKIVVIDGRVGYTGSLNIADPRYFKQGAGVGQWVDAMVRIQGPAVEALAVTFLEDWELETSVDLRELVVTSDLHDNPASGLALVQVLPSGPNSPAEVVKAVVMQALYAARHELVVTTPYFVPDEPLLIAMASAAMRGVDVNLIVPAKNDSKLVDLASRAFEGDLARAGVKIWQFNAGLLHTKSITVDGRFSLFGSVNLDPRSMALNFEITLAVFDTGFTSRLRALQRSYIEGSTAFDVSVWETRPWHVKLAENTARLVGPLL